MNGFTEDELAIAKSVDLVDVARQLGYTPYRIGHYYSLKEMDSIRIYNRTNWFRWSRQFDRGSNGGSQIDFLRVFAGLDVKAAVEWLLEFAGYTRTEEKRSALNENPNDRGCSMRHFAARNEAERTSTRRDFVLPTPAENNSNVFRYLCDKRGISRETVRWFIDRDILYESADHHNAVFKGKAADGTVKFASQRGTYDRDGKGFKCDVAGNDKHYGVNVVSSDPSDKVVHVFEAVIDMMSYADIAGECSMNMVALGMLSDAPLETFLSEHPGKHKLLFHLDNDEPGREATKALMQKYQQKGYVVADDPAPKEYKDINEYLQALGSLCEEQVRAAR